MINVRYVMKRILLIILNALLIIFLVFEDTRASEVGRGNVYSVIEVSFTGPMCSRTDTPARDVDFWVHIKHESGEPTFKIYGFWDGNGSGGTRGKIFKIRFCPTIEGKWFLSEVHSNRLELMNQQEGDYITAAPSSHKGFWIVDTASPGHRWYERSDGSHQYICGNTHYSFLSEYDDSGPSGSNIISDITANADYFNKLRFSVHGDRYSHPADKPFISDSGDPTDDGNYSYRPNPEWFHERVDLAVQNAYNLDIIADLIINGPGVEDSRSILRASKNGGDPTPYLKYIAARYGSYPNVWICLSNEWGKKTDWVYLSNEWKRKKVKRFTAIQIRTFGNIIKDFLSYSTPLSVHANTGNWDTELNTEPAWNDHIIVQRKLKDLSQTADFINNNNSIGKDKPVIDDELAYEGEGDGWSEEDVIESFIGAFLGGGYSTTGYKLPPKHGHYFWGNFNPSEHKSADNLLWLRNKIDSNITFWKLRPVALSQSIFTNINSEFRAMQWENHEYVLGTDEYCSGIKANLPEGIWQVKRFDLIGKTETLFTSDARGSFIFDAPSSRAVLFFFKRK